MLNAVFLDRQTLGRDVSLEPLEQLFDGWQVFDKTAPDQVIARCEHVQVIITNKVVIDSSIISALPNLRLIAIAATGMNNVDLKAAKTGRVKVVNVAGYAAPALAQHTFNLLLQLAGRAAEYQQFIRQGQWQQSEYFCHLGYSMTELNNKVFGVVGYGSLGQAVAKIALAFGMKVIISERLGAQTIRAGRVDFDTLLEQSDVISLHCPEDESNAQMINQARLTQMKPSALLINTARGGLIDESALVEALSQGDIAGAALDVLSTEPPVNGNVLLDYQGHNLIVTPHIAWATVEARLRLISILVTNIKQVIDEL